MPVFWPVGPRFSELWVEAEDSFQTMNGFCVSSFLSGKGDASVPSHV